MPKPQIQISELKDGYTQIIVRQTASDGVGGDLPEQTLVIRNYFDGYVEISNGKDEITIAPDAAADVANWIRKLPGLTPKKEKSK
jgi:hypothetical protein